MGLRGSMAVLGALLSVAILPAGASAATQPEVSVLGDEPVAFEAETGVYTSKSQLLLFNPSQQPIDLEIFFEAKSSDDIALSPTPTEHKLEPGAHLVPITLDGMTRLKKKATGYLVVRRDDTPVTAAPVTVAPAVNSPKDWTQHIFWATVIAFGAMFGLLVVALVASGKGNLLGKLAGSPKWEFDSWATTLTTAGAVLTTVVGELTLPDVPKLFDDDTLMELGLLFGFLLFVGPFLFQVLRAGSADANNQEAGLTGYHWVMLLSMSLTAAAVMGQLLTLGLLAAEMTDNPTVQKALGAVAFGMALLALVYFWRTAWQVAQRDWEAEVAKAAEEAEKEAAEAAKPKKVIVVDDELRDALLAAAPADQQAAVRAPLPRLTWKMP